MEYLLFYVSGFNQKMAEKTKTRPRQGWRVFVSERAEWRCIGWHASDCVKDLRPIVL